MTIYTTTLKKGKQSKTIRTIAGDMYAAHKKAAERNPGWKATFTRPAARIKIKANSWSW